MTGSNEARGAPIAVIEVSPARAVLALSIQAALGLLLAVLAILVLAHSVVLFLCLGLFAMCMLWIAVRVYGSSRMHILLFEDAVCLSDGTELAKLSDIVSIDRSVFAFKPSGGFLVRLKRAGPTKLWLPGLCWRLGRRVGIGGITRAHQSKLVAELLAAQTAS